MRLECGVLLRRLVLGDDVIVLDQNDVAPTHGVKVEGRIGNAERLGLLVEYGRLHSRQHVRCVTALLHRDERRLFATTAAVHEKVS